MYSFGIVAGGALRKSYEKYDEILIFSHYIETLFVPVSSMPLTTHILLFGQPIMFSGEATN
jgi:hypothetical protein